jgi:phage shock protein PspC (stress-responsive transcriptional regulator)
MMRIVIELIRTLVITMTLVTITTTATATIIIAIIMVGARKGENDNACER